MAMLAEPRRKQKVINLRAKNNAWSNDSNKFGQRMLEKMGWSSGKGLGANENGIVEHVIARYKNDEKGLGFEDRNDQWTKHEDNFNALLANLSNGDDKDSQLHSGVSLEIKSKKSKARVHFHKFTRAKDLSRYSEKDLANIFGKKTLKSTKKSEKETKEEVVAEDIKTTEQVFTEKGSMADYFKNKMAALGSKKKMPLTTNENNYDNDVDCGFKGFSGTLNDDEEVEKTSVGFGFQSFSFYNSNTQNNEENYKSVVEKVEGDVKFSEVSSEGQKKKKKKSKKDSSIMSETTNDNVALDVETKLSSSDNDNCIPYDSLIETTKKSKKSKRKRLLENEPVAVVDVKDEPKKKKTKSKKSSNQEQEIMNEDVDQDYIPKKKKKKNK
ncbi:hypothetical protein MSG28_011762 [Choristoneura fumiferana]|uniref:Uncharacterized protein n=1 Tax=Choristoneura fumiferana TaxID=7141 RepID=A0ACC0KM61_CHOFU|nr:hypothetical protein MSG28_011762 [Choristoneura fumiferana]